MYILIQSVGQDLHIVSICGGGVTYFFNAWGNIDILIQYVWDCSHIALI